MYKSKLKLVSGETRLYVWCMMSRIKYELQQLNFENQNVIESLWWTSMAIQNVRIYDMTSVNLYYFILVWLWNKLFCLCKSRSNPFLEPTSTKQWE